ncbi:MAG: dTMP kinase [bacterium]
MFFQNHDPSHTELPGKLIAVEGIEGSGKSTQIYLLKRWFELTGLKVFYTEWSSSTMVKQATLKAKKRHLLTPTTYSLIHGTDFADRYERQILPLLKAGYLVLCDRYIYTAYVRDIVRGCDREWLKNLYSFAVHPDITILFQIPLQSAMERILSNNPHLGYFEAGMDLKLSSDPYENFTLYQQKINEEYINMVDEYNITVLDGSKSITDLQEDLREIIQTRIDLSLYRWRTRA